jgi:hypothetical protein
MSCKLAIIVPVSRDALDNRELMAGEPNEEYRPDPAFTLNQ